MTAVIALIIISQLQRKHGCLFSCVSVYEQRMIAFKILSITFQRFFSNTTIHWFLQVLAIGIQVLASEIDYIIIVFSPQTWMCFIRQQLLRNLPRKKHIELCSVFIQCGKFKCKQTQLTQLIEFVQISRTVQILAQVGAYSNVKIGED